MFVVCSKCSQVHSTKTVRAGGNPLVIDCPCGAEIPVPPEPRETWMHKLRDHLGERLVCGLVGAVLLGGFGIVASGRALALVPDLMAVVGFAIGALLGERLLAWLKIP